MNVFVVVVVVVVVLFYFVFFCVKKTPGMIFLASG